MQVMEPSTDNPVNFKVVCREGVLVRQGVETTSKQVGHLPENTILSVVEVSSRRARMVAPIEGWVSIETKDGVALLKQFDETTSGKLDLPRPVPKAPATSSRPRRPMLRIPAPRLPGADSPEHPAPFPKPTPPTQPPPLPQDPPTLPAAPKARRPLLVNAEHFDSGRPKRPRLAKTSQKKTEGDDVKEESDWYCPYCFVLMSADKRSCRKCGLNRAFGVTDVSELGASKSSGDNGDIADTEFELVELTPETPSSLQAGDPKVAEDKDKGKGKNKSTAKAFADAQPQTQVRTGQLSLQGRWTCSACGFSNSGRNQICGGTGPLGCKAQRQNVAAAEKKEDVKKDDQVNQSDEEEEVEEVWNTPPPSDEEEPRDDQFSHVAAKDKADSTFTMTLEKKSAGDRLGLSVDYFQGRALVVSHVREGMAKDYNASADPSVQIKEGDHIIEINSIRENLGGMVNAIAKSMKLTMVLERQTPEAAGTNQAPPGPKGTGKATTKAKGKDLSPPVAPRGSVCALLEDGVEEQSQELTDHTTSADAKSKGKTKGKIKGKGKGTALEELFETAVPPDVARKGKTKGKGEGLGKELPLAKQLLSEAKARAPLPVYEAQAPQPHEPALEQSQDWDTATEGEPIAKSPGVVTGSESLKAATPKLPPAPEQLRPKLAPKPAPRKKLPPPLMDAQEEKERETRSERPGPLDEFFEERRIISVSGDGGNDVKEASSQVHPAPSPPPPPKRMRHEFSAEGATEMSDTSKDFATTTDTKGDSWPREETSWRTKWSREPWHEERRWEREDRRSSGQSRYDGQRGDWQRKKDDWKKEDQWRWSRDWQGDKDMADRGSANADEDGDHRHSSNSGSIAGQVAWDENVQDHERRESHQHGNTDTNLRDGAWKCDIQDHDRRESRLGDKRDSSSWSAPWEGDLQDHDRRTNRNDQSNGANERQTTWKGDIQDHDREGADEIENVYLDNQESALPDMSVGQDDAVVAPGTPLLDLQSPALPGTLLVAGFPATWSTQQIKPMFTFFGFDSISIVKDPRTDAHAAMVKLKRPENVDKVVAQVHGTEVDTDDGGQCTLSCELFTGAVKEEEETTSESRQIFYVDELPMSNRPDIYPGSTDVEVFIQSLPFDRYSVEHIRQWLDQFGLVIDAAFLCNTQTREFSGNAYVRFSSHDVAASFIKAQDPPTLDERMTVAWSESERLLQGERSVYGASIDSLFESVIASSAARELWMMSESSPVYSWAPTRDGKQLHFICSSDDGECQALRASLTDALVAFHEGVSKRRSTSVGNVAPASDSDTNVLQPNIKVKMEPQPASSSQVPSPPPAPAPSVLPPTIRSQTAEPQGLMSAPWRTQTETRATAASSSIGGSHAVGPPHTDLEMPLPFTLRNPTLRKRLEEGEAIVRDGQACRAAGDLDRAYRKYFDGIQILKQLGPEVQEEEGKEASSSFYKHVEGYVFEARRVKGQLDSSAAKAATTAASSTATPSPAVDHIDTQAIDQYIHNVEASLQSGKPAGSEQDYEQGNAALKQFIDEFTKLSEGHPSKFIMQSKISALHAKLGLLREKVESASRSSFSNTQAVAATGASVAQPATTSFADEGTVPRNTAEWQTQAAQPPSDVTSSLPPSAALPHERIVPGSEASWQSQAAHPSSGPGFPFPVLPQHSSHAGLQYGGMVSGGAVEWPLQATQQQHLCPMTSPSLAGVPSVMGIQQNGMVSGGATEWRPDMAQLQQGASLLAVPQQGSLVGMFTGNAPEWQPQPPQQHLQQGFVYEQLQQQQPFLAQSSLRPPPPPPRVVMPFVPSVVPPPPPLWQS